MVIETQSLGGRTTKTGIAGRWMPQSAHLVRNADHLASDGRAVDVGDFSVLEHSGDDNSLRWRHFELLVARQIWRERIGPVAVKVDGVGDDQLRFRLQVGQDIADLAVGLVRHPSVDGVRGRTAAAEEIHLGDFTQIEIPRLIKRNDVHSLLHNSLLFLSCA